MDKNDRIPPHQLEAEKQTIAVHIFTVSAGLVGACLTVIGLFRVIFKLKAIDSVATRLLAMDAMGFMLACLTAYLALRTASRSRRKRLGLAADLIFIAALVAMVLIGALVAYELI